MDKLDTIFGAYRDYTQRSKDTRRGPQGSREWQFSPLLALGHDYRHFRGKLMAEIPSQFRIPDINPHLIDKLQAIWDRPHTAIHLRLKLLDQLRDNLGRERQIHGPSMEITRLITFHGDPHDGTPPKAAP
ncbi:MAG: hypothetical protein EOR25_15525 [Mesorhizobium sp.]|uniref:hypothetical protein n=1 Tax=Mesorhizobium sp. TaxID=1871066 RepID=UPI000FE2D008|nr:hypothetical protein [Mesorhizobium sp.]RWJ09666.1 MAG: hypothetical protein EOR24_18445 [Mesorhizobium sp.]RWJ16301.1 MAG: hypothetical protein EOR25_15525 [Mesorhizobium sp.]